MKHKKILAYYIRLSQEDMDKYTGEIAESVSVANQRDLLQYAYESRVELLEYDVVEYIDDGYSGTNFNRPGFRRMIEDVKRGKIQCIMVKDFSRFARNFLESGEYLEQIFPFLGVRFISVNDNYDSETNGVSAGNWDVAFKNLMYDLYSKDLSRKVTVAKRSKAKKGEYMGRAPLGYIRSKTIKNQLEIEPIGAKIVRYIFDLALEGVKIPDIVKRLNAENVPTPGTIMQILGKWTPKRKNTSIICWQYPMVWKIIKNRVYTGACINFKRSKVVPCGTQTKKNAEEDQEIVPNCHEAIVTESEFEVAFKNCKIMGVSKRKKNKNKPVSTLLSGTVVCGYCNCTMFYQYRAKMPDIFRCYTTRGADIPLSDDVCDCRAHEVEGLEHMVLNEIHRISQLAEKKYRKMRCDANDQQDAGLKLEAEIGNLKQQIAQKKIEKQDCYELYILGEIEKERYLAVKRNCDLDIQQMDGKIRQMELEMNGQSLVESEDMQILKDVAAYAKEQLLTKEMVQYLIKEIKVYRDNRYEILWNFGNLLEL